MVLRYLTATLAVVAACSLAVNAIQYTTARGARTVIETQSATIDELRAKATGNADAVRKVADDLEHCLKQAADVREELDWTYRRIAQRERELRALREQREKARAAALTVPEVRVIQSERRQWVPVPDALTEGCHRPALPSGPNVRNIDLVQWIDEAVEALDCQTDRLGAIRNLTRKPPEPSP